ncbi:NAD(P)/FAD-dependent oxidoreductase [Dysgonomonas sp. 25]|uniref:NAD(P)/FAD-dependent oxidoreductase n=1 Tax=Dysgonomonas sp. 25 TaxID=2302933 RepID=UPI0013D776B6|nr:NAD(P)/FAD-dependent oxidoreductase [Dysgonomonas sp. 25]NDV70081.1 NAD(P)/FAD-dependent oxidoreductase [Dysgonomonas sp. 25]
MDTKYIANIPGKGALKRILIIGGGFGGLQLAKKLDNKHYQIVMIDKYNYHQFQPLFYQVATAGLEPGSISYPLRKNFQKRKNFHFRMCEAKYVVPDQHIVRTNIGDIPYDYLVIATGCDTNYFGNDALRETTFALKSTPESILLRNKILLSFEEALTAKTEEERKELLTFVVVGGGATGVELSGALADLRKNTLPKDYPEINFNQMEIHLIDGSPRLLAGMSEKASAGAAKALTKRNVLIKHNAFVINYENNLIKMSDGSELRSRNVFWVAGVAPNGLPGMPAEAYEKGRIVIDEYLHVNDCKDIFAIGDTALLQTDKSPKGHPQVAQVALQMATRLAKNLNGKIKNKRPERFAYQDRGSLATIGKYAAVADLGPFKFSGIVAWWLWLFIHILTIVGMRNKVAVFIDWVWNYFNYDVSLRLFIRPKFSKIYEEQDVE